MPLLNKSFELNWQAIIALLTLGFSIWHGWQMRRHNKLSVMPHLTTWTNKSERKNGVTHSLAEEERVKALVSFSLLKNGFCQMPIFLYPQCLLEKGRYIP